MLVHFRLLERRSPASAQRMAIGLPRHPHLGFAAPFLWKTTSVRLIKPASPVLVQPQEERLMGKPNGTPTSIGAVGGSSIN